jgi:hypothetical protein
MISTNTSNAALPTLTPDCSIVGCHRASAVALTQTHPLWASPLRSNVCARHQQALMKEAKSARVTVAVEHDF